MPTLYEQALAIFPYRKNRMNINEEDVEVALAWLKGEINYRQISQVKKIQGSNVYNYLCSALRLAYQTKKLKIA